MGDPTPDPIKAPETMSAKTAVENAISQRKNRTVVFSKSYCPYCRRAKQLLESLGEKYDLRARPDGRRLRLAGIPRPEDWPVDGPFDFHQRRVHRRLLRPRGPAPRWQAEGPPFGQDVKEHVLVYLLRGVQR